MGEITRLSVNKQVLLEKYLREKLQNAATPIDAITRRQRGDYIPLSFGQQQFWLLTQMIPDTPVYNESVTVRLPGPINVSMLEQSLNAFIARHEVWRTTFPMVDGTPMQYIHPELKLQLPVIDLRHLPKPEREPEAIRIATEQARPFFDLTRLPLLRATLIRLDDEDHRLYLTLHHIIFDGTIYKVFLPELSAHYEAFLQEKPSPLEPLPIQYADFALWQRERSQQNTLADQLNYWKKQLAQAPEALDLPTARPRPAVQTYNGKRVFFSLSRELIANLKTLSQSEGVTLYMLLVTAFKVLLHRYTGQTDVLIGSTIGGHDRQELQKLIGVFLNTLVLRTDLSGNPTFQELLKRVRDVVLDANAHSEIPFTSLVKELQPKRDPARPPLIQVMLSLEPPLPVLPSGWTITQSDVEIDTAKFDIDLELDDRPDGFDAWLCYNTDLFDEATIRRMVGHWQTMLEGIVANPSQRIADLPLLTETERQQLLVEWNATQVAYPADQCVHQVFEVQVEQTPNAVAVVYENQQLTYQQLNEQANQLAHYLRQRGAGPEVLVGLCMERSLEMIVALLAILKAGAAYVPLDPTHPRERLSFLLADTSAPILLTQQALLAVLPEYEVQVVCLDTDLPAIAQMPITNPISKVSQQNLAYVLYTSGSTGQPKGVAIEHRQLLNYTCAILERLDLTPGFRFAMLQPLTFDFGITTIFPTLMTGGCLHVISRERTLDATSLKEYLQQQEIDCFKITPSHLAALHASSDGHALMPRQCLILGGESSSWEWLQSLHTATPDCKIFNHYGPTETTVGVLTYQIGKEPPGHSYTKTPTGRPLANVRIYVLDKHLQPVPIGVPGELYIGGASVGRGYLNRPELTAEKFIADPFSAQPDARLYKTGDLARYLPDGNIDFLGRSDDQVKIRGFRVEPGEVQDVLSHHPAVQHALVIAREDTLGEKQLVGYVVLHQGHTATSADLQNYMMKQLPTYMVPSAIVLLDALPMMGHGKVDRKALPSPEMSRAVTKETFVAPSLLEHYQLIQIWEELLDARPIGIRDNFFDLGGHSLLATRLVARIEQVFAKKITLSTLLAGPTIEKLTRSLRQQANSQNQTPITIIQAGRKEKRPFFFMHGDWTGGPFYCFTLARTFGAEQPFYTLEPYHFNGPEMPLTLEELATAHLKALRAIQPEGPYLLGGFCNGALIVYEMAHQLHTQGQEVDLLLLIASSAATSSTKLMYTFSQWVSTAFLLEREQQLDLYLRIRHVIRHVYRLLRPADDKKIRDFSKLTAIDARLNGILPPREALRNDYVGISTWLTTPYVRHFYPKKATFIWEENELANRSAWRDVASTKDSYTIPGEHMDSVTKYIDLLATIMNSNLKNVQEEANKL